MPIIPIGRTLAVHVVFTLFVFVFSLFLFFALFVVLFSSLCPSLMIPLQWEKQQVCEMKLKKKCLRKYGLLNKEGIEENARSS